MKEKLLCHAIIGRSGGKELVKKVKVVCEFINPLLQLSTQSICFNVCKVFTYLFLTTSWSCCDLVVVVVVIMVVSQIQQITAFRHTEYS